MPVLSDRDIKERLKKGDLIIEPLDNLEKIQGACVDLSLGTEFRIFKYTEEAMIDSKNPKEYTPWQLWKKIKRNEGDKTAFILALNRKLSLPFAAFIFPILGACLGLIQFKRPSGGIILAIFFFILYQICFSAAISLGKANILPPQIGPWLPNIGLLIAIFYFFRRLLHE